MTLQEIKMVMANIKKGQMVKVHYQTKGKELGYTKETQMVVRFVEYANINGVQAKGKANPNESYDNNGIIYNSNTQEYYLQMATINTNYKPETHYYLNGVEITKNEYEIANPSKPRTQPLVVFRKNIKDIISLG